MLLVNLLRHWYLIGYGREITGARQICVVTIVKMDITPPTATHYLRSFSELTEINLYIYRQNILIYICMKNETTYTIRDGHSYVSPISRRSVQMSPLTLIEAWQYLSIAPNYPFSLCLDPPYIGSWNSHSCYDKITILWDVTGQGFFSIWKIVHLVGFLLKRKSADTLLVSNLGFGITENALKNTETGIKHQQWHWDLRCSGILRSVHWQFRTDVSR